MKLTFRCLRILVTFGVLLFLAASSFARDTSKPGILWRVRERFSLAPSPAAADLDLDGTLEIILAGPGNRIMTLHPADRSTLWEEELPIKGGLTHTAATGHFLPYSGIDVMVVSSEGELVILSGGTGKILLQANIGFQPAETPTVFPLAPSDPARPDFLDGVAIVKADGRMVGFGFGKTDKPRILFEFKLTEVFKYPAMVGHTGYDKPGPHLVAVSSDGKIHIISAVEGSHDLMMMVIPWGISDVWPMLGDVDGDGTDDIVVADSLGYVHAYTIRNNKFEKVWDRVSIQASPFSQLALIDVNHDGRQDVVVPKNDLEYMLLDGSEGTTSTLWKDQVYVHDAFISGPASVFESADKKSFALFSDKKGRVNILDLARRAIATSSAGGPLQFDVGGYAARDAIIAPISGGREAQAFLLDWVEGTGYLLSLGMEMNPAAPAWLGYQAGGWRTGSLSRAYHDYVGQQQKHFTRRFEETLAEARKHYAASNWPRALESANEALGTSPKNREARRIRRLSIMHDNITVVYCLGLVAASILGFIGLRTTRFTLRANRLRRARHALTGGEKEKAAEIMLAAYKNRPPSVEELRALADLLLDTRRFDASSAETFDKAHEAFPQDSRYLQGLAQSYWNLRRGGVRAAQIYEEMRHLMPQGGLWAFAVGQTYIALKDDTHALEAFREAIRDGYLDPQMDYDLADLYVRLGMTSGETVLVMSRVIDERQNDKAFLQAFCKVCLANRLYDEKAQRASRWLLSLDPAAPEAHLVLSTALLQTGLVKESMLHAEAILQNNPTDPAGLRLLGECYASEKRLDETAMNIFQQALVSNPDDTDILLAVSHGFIQSSRDDDAAEGIYRRALKGNPDDETVLEYLAGIAAKRIDDDLTIETVGRLVKLGNQSRKYVMQLSEAYCRKNDSGPDAESIYREALVFQPDHATIAAQLATIWVRSQRVDAEAITLFESVLERNPARLDVSRQLAAAYDKAELADRTLALTRKILTENPDDQDMQKLQAHASVALDQMDSAIQSYEQVLERDRHDVETNVRLAVLYGKKRLSDERALKVYRRAARAQPDNFEVHAAMARAWAKEGNAEQVVTTIKHFLSHAPKEISAAIGLMEELVDTTPGALELRWFLVDTLTYETRLPEASRHLIDVLHMYPDQSPQVLQRFEKILDKNPKDAIAHQQRGRILFSAGRTSEARQAFEFAHRYKPADDSIARDLMTLYEKLLEKMDSLEIRYQLGLLALDHGKFDLGISCFQRTEKDSRWEVASIKHLARCFSAKGMLDLATAEVRRIPMDDDVKEILYTLAQRYESLNDIKAARDAYKIIFAADIEYQDVKAKLENLDSSQHDVVAAERTAIMSALSETAKARYELIEELGRGAMGIVYKARDNELDELVALKILPETLGQNREALRRFRQEARNARHLSHHGIVRIHDIGEEMGRKYISMEFVSGTDLKHRILEAERKLPFSETLDYSKQVCSAMIAAHGAGIVHRDLKPANIMITLDKKIKITDFGIAKAVEDDAVGRANETTRIGAIVGTPLYMSPEQVQGLPVDFRSDIYSLGVVFYEMASGNPPFTEGDLAYHHVFTQPKPLEGVPKAYADVVMKCLGKKPDQRWPNVREMLAELKRIAV